MGRYSLKNQTVFKGVGVEHAMKHYSFDDALALKEAQARREFNTEITQLDELGTNIEYALLTTGDDLKRRESVREYILTAIKGYDNKEREHVLQSREHCIEYLARMNVLLASYDSMKGNEDHHKIVPSIGMKMEGLRVMIGRLLPLFRSLDARLLAQQE